MKEYIVNKYATKNDFLWEGFKFVGLNVLQKTIPLFKREILFDLVIDFKEDPCGLYVDFHYEDGRIYTINSEYGTDLVREKVLINYEKEMDKLIKLGLINEVVTTRKNGKRRKAWQK